MSSTWMINGPGQALFVGNPNVSQFNPTGQNSPGSGYIPDEVAKQLVKEAGLRKSDTVSKRTIVGYLESMGLSAGLAPDVAMVLRNMYGVTPTFDESTLYGRSNELVEELMGALDESYPAPFRVDAPELLSEMDEVARFIYLEYMDSSDAEYDVVLESLAGLSPHEFLDIYEFYEFVGPSGFAYLADLVENGPEGLADEVLEGMFNPDGVMSEDVQYYLDQFNEASDYASSRWAAQDKRRGIAQQRQGKGRQISDRKQMKKAYRDRHGGERSDPLAAKSSDAKDSPAVRSAKLAALKDRQTQRKAAKQKETYAKMDAHLKKGADAGAAEYHKKKADKAAAKTASRAAMKEKGKRALDFVKSIPGKVVGGAIDKAGYVHGRGKAAIEKGHAAKQAKSQAPAQGDTGPAKPKGIMGKLGSAFGSFKAGMKHGYEKNTPGIQSQKKKKDSESGGRESGPVHSPQAAESFARQGELLSEMRTVLDGPNASVIPEPVDVLSCIESRDIVGQAVIEALSQLDWDEISQIASVALLPTTEAFALVNSYLEGSDSFFHEWREVSSRTRIPSALKKESFSLIGSLSMDEGIIPKLIEYSIDALADAGPEVSACVEDAYPDLGKSVYGPAGDPRSGPNMAKSYMTPHGCGTDSPMKDREVMTTRMFSDPDVREKERTSRLSDVVKVLGGMQQAAAHQGVDPEGMFLNTYRDLHREKARYS